MTERTSLPELPALGTEGEVCSGCQSPLAIDQRYCLQCGKRRGASRVEFADLLPAHPVAAAAGETAPPPPPSAVAPNAAAAQGPWTPFAMVASIAILALMLLVGVMIGKDDEPTQVTAAAPAAPVAAATPTDTAAATGAAGADGGTGGAGGGAAGGGGSGGGGGGGGGGETAAVKEPPPAESAPGAEVIDQSELGALDDLTGEEQQEASKNLPDTIAIPGEPPPTDNEEPGGGTKAEVIG